MYLRDLVSCLNVEFVPVNASIVPWDIEEFFPKKIFRLEIMPNPNYLKNSDNVWGNSQVGICHYLHAKYRIRVRFRWYSNRIIAFFVPRDLPRKGVLNFSPVRIATRKWNQRYQLGNYPDPRHTRFGMFLTRQQGRHYKHLHKYMGEFCKVQKLDSGENADNSLHPLTLTDFLALCLVTSF